MTVELELSKMTKAFTDALGIERGIILGTKKDGTTKTIIINPKVSDLALYSKLLDHQLFKVLDKGDKNDNRDSRTDGVGEVSSSGDTRTSAEF